MLQPKSTEMLMELGYPGARRFLGDLPQGGSVAVRTALANGVLAPFGTQV